MIAPFRELIAGALASPAQLEAELAGLNAQQWEAVAELFSARLPEFDAVYGVPGAESLAQLVAQARGVPNLSTSESAIEPGNGGEVVVLTAHLQDGLPEQQTVRELQRAGWRVLLVAAALERTNGGARTHLAEHNVKVRAAVQLADTPNGLVFERRSPERWAS